ncbi:MAG: division/cell wall cluster transcriptional repressor MraZ [Planctomycetota bacterium]
MAHLFTGTFLRSLDAKNRVLVPSELRDALDAADRKGLYLVPTKRCVALWPRSDLEAYAASQGADPFGNLGFNRSFYSRLIFKSFDGTGRIVLPAPLVERFADKEVLIAGVGRHLEAWHPADFEKEMAANELDLG